MVDVERPPIVLERYELLDRHLLPTPLCSLDRTSLYGCLYVWSLGRLDSYDSAVRHWCNRMDFADRGGLGHDCRKEVRQTLYEND